MVTTLPRLMTIEEVEAMGPEAERYELIRGVLREVEGMSEKHGMFAGRFHWFIADFVYDRDLGEVFSSDTRFAFPGNPPSWAAPDVSYISADRLPFTDLKEGYSRRIPNVAVEVKSPSNTEADILDKIAVYLGAGVTLVWLVRPLQQTVTVFRQDRPEIILGIDDVLDGEDVLPGFRLPLRDIFRAPRGTLAE